MDLRSYLPSSHFATIAISVAAAGVLVLVAHYATRPPKSPAEITSATLPAPEDDWQLALEQIQAQAPGLPAAPDEDTIQGLLEAARDSNITSSVARSLFVNLTDKSAQGLGSDIPTQEKLISEASSRISGLQAKRYASGDLTIVAQNKDNSRTWGNEVMLTFASHPRANNDDAIYLMGYATDYSDPGSLESLGVIASAYASLARELAEVPVPSTYAPLHLQLVNNLSQMSAAAKEMQYVIEDPLRGLSGLQAFQTAGTEATRVLTTLAEQLNKGGILFNKDEAGSLWTSFLSSP